MALDYREAEEDHHRAQRKHQTKLLRRDDEHGQHPYGQEHAEDADAEEHQKPAHAAGVGGGRRWRGRAVGNARGIF